MQRKRAFLLIFVLVGVPIRSLSAYDAKTRGQRILVEESDTLFVMNPDGTDRHKVAENVTAAALSGDGNLVSYADHKGVYVFSLADDQSSTVALLTEGSVDDLAWSPDQKHLAYDVGVPKKSLDLFLASYPPSGVAPRNLGHWYESISFSPNGKFIVHPAFDETNKHILETVNVETAKRETIYKATDTIWAARYAPGGSSIAFTMAKTVPRTHDDDEPECGGPNLDLWVLPLDSKQPVKIMEKAFAFDWSPDGRFLAIDRGTEDCGYPPGDSAVFISSLDQKVQFQLSKDAPSMGAVFSPDSKYVMFIDSDGSHLVVGDVSTRKLSPLPRASTHGFTYLVYGWK